MFAGRYISDYRNGFRLPKTKDFNAITTQEFSKTLASLYSEYSKKTSPPSCETDYYAKDAHCAPCPEKSSNEAGDSVTSTSSLTCRCEENFKPVDDQCVACPDGWTGPNAAGRLLDNDSYDSSCTSVSTTPASTPTSDAQSSLRAYVSLASVCIALMLAVVLRMWAVLSSCDWLAPGYGRSLLLEP